MKSGAEIMSFGVSFLQGNKNEKLYEKWKATFHQWVAFQEL